MAQLQDKQIKKKGDVTFRNVVDRRMDITLQETVHEFWISSWSNAMGQANVCYVFLFKQKLEVFHLVALH